MLSLERVDEQNLMAGLSLSVSPDQAPFIPRLELSICYAYTFVGGRLWIPYLIRHKEEYIGSVTISVKGDNANISGFFIDQRFQKNGFGKLSLELIKKEVHKQCPTVSEITLLVHPLNHIACSMYLKGGFQKTDTLYGEEVLYIHSVT